MKSASRDPLLGIDLPTVRRVTPDHPWTWLAKGWADIQAAPVVSLSYGLVVTAVSIGLALGSAHFGWQGLFLALAGGFLLVGPLVAVGLYETSRRLEEGLPPSLSAALLVAFRAPGQLGYLGVALMLIYFVWLELALVLFSIFLGTSGLPDASEFIPQLLMTRKGVALLAVGSIAGGILALVVYAISVVATPLLLVRRMDVVSAMMSSIRAVTTNPWPMALWAAIIVVLMACSFATALVGMIIAFPLLGHASWHAFRDLIDLDGGPG